MSPKPQLPFIWTATIIHGEALGRTINFPTANFERVPQLDSIEPGVYFGNVLLPTTSTKLPALIYFGPRLVLNETNNVFEAFIYDFDGDLYDLTLTAELTDFIRPPLKFDSFTQMKEQLEEDKRQGQSKTKQLFNF